MKKNPSISKEQRQQPPSNGQPEWETIPLQSLCHDVQLVISRLFVVSLNKPFRKISFPNCVSAEKLANFAHCLWDGELVVYVAHRVKIA